jgi:uncharacterized membrane protein/predicted RNA-binding Zn-ribbon protein involved in translation (DUF1610 family)
MDIDSPIGRHCKKCGHIRKRDDKGPDYACPSCGGVYAKVQAVVHQREEVAREAARHADFSVMQPPAPPPPPVLPESVAAERRRAQLVQTGYILQLVPLGITAVIGAVIARGIVAAHPSSWLASHARWQLRTFWTALVIGLVLAALAMLLVGGAQLASRMGDGAPVVRSGARWLWLPATALWLWVAYRVARGWLLLVRGETV